MLGGRLDDAPPARRAETKAALQAWLDDCRRVPGSTAVLYVAGHGVFNERTGSNLLLEDLEDRLDLDMSVDLADVTECLGHIGLDASYVFVDCCQPILKSGRRYGGLGLRRSITT